LSTKKNYEDYVTLGDDPVMLSYHNGKTVESHPSLECGPVDKPTWITYAESRGGDLSIEYNDAEKLTYLSPSLQKIF